MHQQTSTLGRFPKLIRRLRPSLAEVEHYATLILQHEQRPTSALAACRAEAELHLWTIRSLFGTSQDAELQLEGESARAA